MGQIDWIILVGTLLFIVLYGTYKARGSKNVTDYLKGGSDSRWWTIGLSVMATQASAITFLSTPGQAFHDGMGFLIVAQEITYAEQVFLTNNKLEQSQEHANSSQSKSVMPAVDFSYIAHHKTRKKSTHIDADIKNGKSFVSADVSFFV